MELEYHNNDIVWANIWDPNKVIDIGGVVVLWRWLVKLGFLLCACVAFVLHQQQASHSLLAFGGAFDAFALVIPSTVVIVVNWPQMLLLTKVSLVMTYYLISGFAASPWETRCDLT